MATLRRLYRSGNSIVVALPDYMLANADLDVKDRVCVELRKDGVIALRKWTKPPNTGLGSIHSVRLDPTDPLLN